MNERSDNMDSKILEKKRKKDEMEDILNKKADRRKEKTTGN